MAKSNKKPGFAGKPEFFKKAFELAPDTFFMMDLKGTFIYMNGAAESLLGYRKEYLIGKNFKKAGIVSKESLGRAVSSMQKSLAGKPTGPDEYTLIRKDGSEIYVEVVIRHIKFGGKDIVFGTVRDITDRRKAEEELKRTADEWNRTFDSISDMIFIQDRSFRILRANKSFTEAFKIKAEEIIGKKCHEIVHKSGRPWPNCPFGKTLKDGMPHTEEVDDPKIGVTLLVTTSPIFDKNGNLTGSVHIAKDISRMKSDQDELKRRNEELEKINKLAVGRELRMIELKKRIAELEKKLA